MPGRIIGWRGAALQKGATLHPSGRRGHALRARRSRSVTPSGLVIPHAILIDSNGALSLRSSQTSKQSFRPCRTWAPPGYRPSSGKRIRCTINSSSGSTGSTGVPYCASSEKPGTSSGSVVSSSLSYGNASSGYIIPLVTVLVFFGIIIAAGSAIGAGPFIYTIFRFSIDHH